MCMYTFRFPYLSKANANHLQIIDLGSNIYTFILTVIGCANVVKELTKVGLLLLLLILWIAAAEEEEEEEEDDKKAVTLEEDIDPNVAKSRPERKTLGLKKNRRVNAVAVAVATVPVVVCVLFLL